MIELLTLVLVKYMYIQALTIKQASRQASTSKLVGESVDALERWGEKGTLADSVVIHY